MITSLYETTEETIVTSGTVEIFNLKHNINKEFFQRYATYSDRRGNIKLINKKLREQIGIENYIIIEVHQRYICSAYVNMKQYYFNGHTRDIVENEFKRDNLFYTGVIIIFQNERDKIATEVTNCFGAWQ